MVGAHLVALIAPALGCVLAVCAYKPGVLAYNA
jgi:hypothetical protein